MHVVVGGEFDEELPGGHGFDGVAVGVENGDGEHAALLGAAEDRTEEGRGAGGGVAEAGLALGELLERDGVEDRGVAFDEFLANLGAELDAEAQEQADEDGE